MVRLWSIGFLLQVGRCYMEDHGAWRELFLVRQGSFVSERCDSCVTCISLECINLCYVIGTSARTRSKKSSIIRLVYKPFVLSPHLSLTTPLSFFGQKCSLYHLIATVSSAILVQASPADRSSITSKSDGLAQVITQSMVPGTAALTFDDVRGLHVPSHSNTSPSLTYT